MKQSITYLYMNIYQTGKRNFSLYKTQHAYMRGPQTAQSVMIGTF